MRRRQRLEVLPAPDRGPHDGVRPVSRDFMPDPGEAGDGASCTSQGCINLNVQRGLVKLAEDREQLESRERSLLGFVARNGVEDLDGTLLSLVLEPVFESIEQVYGTVDALGRYADHEPGDVASPCPYESLMEELGQKMRLYLRIEEENIEEILAELEVFAPGGISTVQTLDSLDGDTAGQHLPCTC